jgi:hypothetical protein
MTLPSERELMEAISPVEGTASQPSIATPEQPPTGETPQVTPPPAPQVAPFVFMNDRFEPAPQTQPGEANPPPPATAAPAAGATSKPVDWEELATQGQQRVIRIPAEKLQQGDPNYDIVIHTGDWIWLDAGYVGV